MDERLYLLKRQIEELKKYRGSGTQLISLYIPPSRPIAEVSNQLRSEISQAQNIKSKTTRENVISALEKILTFLKGFKKAPENGIAIFCGNISENPSKTDIRLFYVIPPLPLNVSIYRCDSSFFLEPLERFLYSRDKYGILLIDGKEATLAILQGPHVQIVRRMSSGVHSRFRKGGQSARRFERLIEQSIQHYYKRVGEAMDEVFLNQVKGVIVGGPGPTKDYFLREKPFNYQIKILGVVDTGYADETGIEELLEKAKSILEKQEAVEEKKIVERFIKEIVNNGLAVYGYKETKEAIEEGRAEILLVSEALPFKLAKYSCRCGYQEEKLDEDPKPIRCPNCNSIIVPEVKNLADSLIDLAREYGVEYKIISTATREGEQFLNGFGGIGAILKYKKY